MKRWLREPLLHFLLLGLAIFGAFSVFAPDVCGRCGRAISAAAGYIEQSLLSHTYAPGTSGLCLRAGSVSPSHDYICLGDLSNSATGSAGLTKCRARLTC